MKTPPKPLAQAGVPVAVSTRDEFSSETKDVLSRRVNNRCSNPNCRKPTGGPHSDPEKALNIGVAAHISAASKDGPRFNKALSVQERKSAENGIWLCQNCAKLVDNDTRRYTDGLLRQWKEHSEKATFLDVEQLTGEAKRTPDDAELLRFFAQCFDRPAFQDPFHQEGSTEAFDKAIEDTITAINTGCLRSRDGDKLTALRGKAFLRNPKWSTQMDTVVDMLRAIRSRYADAVARREISVHDQGQGQTSHLIRDRMLCDWMDSTREQALVVFGEIASEAGITAPHFPRRRHPHW